MKAQKKEKEPTLNEKPDAVDSAELARVNAIRREHIRRLHEIAARLTESKHLLLDETYADGYDDAEIWAKEQAEESQLRCLASHKSQVSERSESEDKLTYSTAEYIAFLIEPRIMGDRLAAADFWALATDRREVPSTNYVLGFMDGAVAVWTTVENLV